MNYESKPRIFSSGSGLILAAFALLFMPMSPSGRQDIAAQQTRKPAAGAASQPQVVSTNPARGATNVSAGLSEIKVVFDRDMGQGMSWTGGPPLFPPIDMTRQARWSDARTCVLPVKLEKGTYYCLGINSSSHQNFKSNDGVAAPPGVLCFATSGATKDVEQRVQPPTIAELTPANGAKDVDPKITTLKVTFSVPMGEGMSWTGGGPQFPKLAPGEKPRWSADGLTCTLPVSLEPNHDYSLGLNSTSHINFQSKWGVPLTPVPYQFRTRSE